VPPLLLRLGFDEIASGEQFGNPARRFRLAREDWHGLRPRRAGSRDAGTAPD
jgi:hypothetical protein